MEFNINLANFGLQNVQAIRYDGATASIINNALNSGSLGSVRTSYLGTPIISDLILERIPKANQPSQTVQFDTILLEVTQTKNIVTTAIVGRNGTVKEYIADGDYQVKLRGALVEPKGGFPEQQLRELVKLLLLPEAIKPVSDYLRLFDIHQLVVIGYNFSQREGLKNVQFFEIDCLSDTPERLILDLLDNIDASIDRGTAT